MAFLNAMPNPPIGLGYLAAVLKEHGHQVEIIDCAIQKESYSQIISQVKQSNPDVVGITALSSYYDGMRKLAHRFQELGIPVVLGGVHASSLPEFSLRDCKADFVVSGEGEYTTLELIQKWQDEETRKKVKGIAYIENGKFKTNPKREPIQNLDEIPFPAWDLISPLNYPPIPHGRVMKRYPLASILTTRGCPFSCSYCASTQFWGGNFRRRSSQNVADEIEYLVDKFGVREIHIWDDNFTLIKKHVIGICREVLRRKLDLKFSCPNGVRIDSLNKEILQIMKRVGFYSLTFAIESGAQSILDRANKKLNLKVIPKMVKIAKSLGYYIPSYFIFGLPGETYNTARQTIQLAKKLPLDIMTSFIAKPLPGSKLFTQWVQSQNLSEINYKMFHFYGADNKLELSENGRKLILPKDAYQEFFFRPIQIWRFIKLWVTHFHLKQFFPIVRNIYNFFVKRKF